MASPPALVDHLGRPLRSAVTRQALEEIIARPSLTGVRQAWNATTIASGLTPERLAAIMRASADGDAHDYLTLAEEMEERDWHYAAELGKRKLAVLGLDRIVTPADDSDQAHEIAEAVRTEIVQDEAFDDLAAGLLDGLGKGWSAVEIGWRTGRRYLPVAYEHRDPRWFRFDRETGHELRLLTDEAPTEGEALAPYRFAVHRPQIKQGLPIRGGLARLAAWAFLFKFYGVKDWAAFAETYGQPLRLGKYDASATPADVDILYQAVAMIGTDCAAVIPKSMEIDFVKTDGGAGSGGDLYQRWCDWLDRQVSKAVVGQSGTADVQRGGGHAQSTVLDEVRGDLREADARQLARTIRRDVFAPYVAFNYGAGAPVPLFAIDTPESEDLKALSEALGPMIDRGLKVKATQIRAKFNLDAPEGDDEVLTPVSTAPAPAPAPETAALNRRAFAGALVGALNRAERAADRDFIDELTAEGAARWREVMGPLIEPYERLAASVSSYEEFAAALTDAMAEGDATELARALGAAFYKARAFGDVRDS